MLYFHTGTVYIVGARHSLYTYKMSTVTRTAILCTCLFKYLLISWFLNGFSISTLGNPKFQHQVKYPR